MKLSCLILLVFILILVCGCGQEEPEEEESAVDNYLIEEAENGTAEVSPLSEEEKELIEETEIELEGKLVMFHNNRGPMCIAQLDFLEEMKHECPSLVIEEYLTTEPGTISVLFKLESRYGRSEGVSTTFEYLPITFVNDHAYSGFNSFVRGRLMNDVKEVCK